MTTIAQIRGARGLVGWSQGELASAAGLTESAVQRLETGAAAGSDADLAKVAAALEAAGVEFIAEDGGGVGVRLRKPAPDAIPLDQLNASNDE